MNYKRPLTFVLTFLIFQFISCTVILKSYMNGVNKISKKEFNLSTYPNYLINLFIWSFGYWLMALTFYYLFHKINESITVVTYFGLIIYLTWDAFPIAIIQDGYKHLPVFLYDIFITGGVCIAFSSYIYKNYYNILSKNLYILGILYVISFLVFFYEGFIFDRQGTENNWLVKLGDSINMHKILPYVRLNL